MGGKVEGLGKVRVGHLVVTATRPNDAACLVNQAAGVTNFDRGCHGRILPEDGRTVKVGRGALLLIGGDALQDLQELGTVSGTVEKGGCEVAGHDRIRG